MKRKASRTIDSGLTRRDLLRVVQVAGVGAVGASLVTSSTAESEVIRGTCRLCVMHCGIRAKVRADRIERVEGDPRSRSRGFICMHAHALGSIVHSRDRVARPLQRFGDRFRPVEWRLAYERIAERLVEIARRHGPEAIVVQTGWPLVRHPLVPMLQRFCAALGSPNLVTVASVCEAAGRMGKSLVAGSNFWPEARTAKTLIVWGANPPVAAPPFSKPVHAMNRRGHHLIVVDVQRTDLANHAKQFLRVRPGTDGALALGMIRWILREGLHDADYVEANTVGLESLREATEPYTLERVESITSVPAAQVAKAARTFAENGPGCIWDGLGVEHHENGVQTVRAISALQAICGYLDVGGGGVLHDPIPDDFGQRPLPAFFRPRTPKPIPPTPKAKPLGWSEFPLYHAFNGQAQGTEVCRAILEDQPYPVRALILFGSNPLVTYPDSGRTADALDRLDLLVSIDPFLCETGERADFVLPAATFLEGEESGERVARNALMPARAQSRPDWQILFELARASGLERWFPWTSFDEALRAPHFDYLESMVPDVRPVAQRTPPRFSTRSGKIELHSETMESFGQSGALSWSPPTEATSSAFPLRLVSGPRTRAYINSQFRHISPIARVEPRARVCIHPSTARDAGIRPGDDVFVISPRGRARFQAEVTDTVHPEVAVIPAGWSGAANANTLTDGRRRDPISGFPALRSSICRIEAALPSDPKSDRG